MLDETTIEFADNLSDLLPKDEGSVTTFDRKEGDSMVRTWAVEFPQQTVHLVFVFDDTEENERAYAELLARGGPLIYKLMTAALQANNDKLTTLKAFQLVFNTLMGDLEELSAQFQSGGSSEVIIPPTVGEK